MESNPEREPTKRSPGLPAIAPILETLLRRTHRQYGFPCWKGRLALSFRLFGCERGSHCVHESTSQGACGNWNSCELCCTRSHRHRSHLAHWPGGGGRNDLAESAEAPRDCRRSSRVSLMVVLRCEFI